MRRRVTRVNRGSGTSVSRPLTARAAGGIVFTGPLLCPTLALGGPASPGGFKVDGMGRGDCAPSQSNRSLSASPGAARGVSLPPARPRQPIDIQVGGFLPVGHGQPLQRGRRQGC